MKKVIAVFIVAAIAIFPMAADNISLINKEDSPVKIYFEVETGLFGVLNHTYQSGRTDEGAYNFDFVNEGGQDILFPFERYVTGMVIKNKHKIGLLYQPLTAVTNVTFRDDVMIDSVIFTEGTPMEIKYGFPFYRFTYSYFFVNNEKLQLAGGIALQARNASIVFKEVSGEQMTVSQNVGPVPAFQVYGRYNFNSGLYLTLDATGLYASSAIINGASFSFEGSILDASLRAGYPLRNGVDVFANLRFLGGTAKGESEYTERTWSEPREAYTSNVLSTMSFTLGLSIY
ncbi:MAG: hypothetical protein K9N05_02160 [Candidatus Marinimicrobia bacterium]|nr:hypothetical protein [Candidatus Neomarinimicrobiota bacterium]